VPEGAPIDEGVIPWVNYAALPGESHARADAKGRTLLSHAAMGLILESNARTVGSWLHIRLLRRLSLTDAAGHTASRSVSVVAS
jgi:hypothetical protein